MISFASFIFSLWRGNKVLRWLPTSPVCRALSGKKRSTVDWRGSWSVQVEAMPLVCFCLTRCSPAFKLYGHGDCNRNCAAMFSAERSQNFGRLLSNEFEMHPFVISDISLSYWIVIKLDAPSPDLVYFLTSTINIGSLYGSPGTVAVMS
jgi:hypothetical protein